jgi:uncharacterized protein YsxB (DUF464 family)
MVTVTFRRDSRHRLSSVFAKGHAGWAESGSDIVCAAVSAILQAACAGLQEHAKLDVGLRRGAGELSFTLPESARDDAAAVAIVRTAEISIEQIARQHPEHVAAVSERES